LKPTISAKILLCTFSSHIDWEKVNQRQGKRKAKFQKIKIAAGEKIISTESKIMAVKAMLDKVTIAYVKSKS
jgi:hypothetical protein